jgi:hypothetical protein
MKPNKDFNEKDVKNDVGFDSMSKEYIEVKVTICIQVVMIILIQPFVCVFFGFG